MAERAEYAAEGIALEAGGGDGDGAGGAGYEDNGPCVELLEGRGDGLLALLDEEGRVPGGWVPTCLTAGYPYLAASYPYLALRDAASSTRGV